MQEMTTDSDKEREIENAEIVEEMIDAPKTAAKTSEQFEELQQEQDAAIPQQKPDFIRNHILLVRPAANIKAKGPKL